jgi:hypothetical protein
MLMRTNPEDNVFVKIEPTETYEYKYEIVSDHSGIKP